MHRLSLQARPISLAVTLALTSLCVSAQNTPVAASAAPVQALDIPAQPAVQALQRLVELTKLQLVYSPDIVNNLTTKPIQGSFTAKDALVRMLDGSGLEVVDTGVNALTIRPTDAASGHAREPQTLQSVVVTGISHLASTARTGTRTDADPMTLPMSVTTVDKELLARQQALTLRDAVTNVAGVSDLNGDGSFSMRGFAAGIMRDGNLSMSGLAYDPPTIAISKVEVVKGPEAIIGGLTSGYGGIVNVITKTPQIEPVAEVTSTVGSRGYYQLGMDVGKPLNEDKSLLARFVASKQSAGDTFVGYDGARNQYAAPSLTWRNKNSGTEITTQYEYQKFRVPTPEQVFTDQPSLNDALPLLRLGAQGEGTLTTNNTLNVSLAQRIVSGWDLAAKYSDSRRKNTFEAGQSGLGETLGLPFPEVVTFVAQGDSSYRDKAVKLELKGSFETGPVEHKILLAFDDMRSTADGGQRYVSIYSTNVATGVVTDLGPTLGPPLGGLPTERFAGAFKAQETGLLVMDQIAWGDWIALPGFRTIRFEPDAAISPGLGVFKKSLPSLGVVYQASPVLSIYGNASKGFTPNLGLFSIDGSAVAPEDAQQFEFGAKALAMDRKVATTVAIYSIKQKNVAVEDPAPPGVMCSNTVCYRTVSGVRSQGAEVEVSGEVYRGLGVRASYSYNNKKAESVDQLGVFYARHVASLWTTYRFDGQADTGWWAGAGLQTRSARNAGTSLDADNPGRTRFDLNAGFDSKQWNLVAGVKNLTDKRLYNVGSGSNGIGTVYQHREFYLTGRYSFY